MTKFLKSEGDINISPRRDQWQKDNIDANSRALLDEDARYFLRQSLSTPCLNTMRTCEGIRKIFPLLTCIEKIDLHQFICFDRFVDYLTIAAKRRLQKHRHLPKNQPICQRSINLIMTCNNL